MESVSSPAPRGYRGRRFIPSSGRTVRYPPDVFSRVSAPYVNLSPLTRSQVLLREDLRRNGLGITIGETM